MRVGILAVQGAFAEHEKMLTALGCECKLIRKREDIGSLDALVLPGGESTVQRKLINELGMFAPLKEIITSGTPTLATCAGMILLAQKVANDEHTTFETLPVTVKRNAYGRQLASFHIKAPFEGLGEVPMTFIRAPYVESIESVVSVDSVKSVENIKRADSSENIERVVSFENVKGGEIVEECVRVLARVDGKIVAVRYDNQLALSFHPELDDDTQIHRLFLSLKQSS